ncbi:MAG TPA: NADH:ubiquinone oxidoreductase subunit NDUFA12 [Stellaceae bacterium]|jgi:NADH:ubiquinone oxidoreductase subunit|nr:NADH:ubiquinone oxidoreductase subunit NDUFA12 [Stellaceae bacterium]
MTIGTRLFTWWKGKLVGADQFGNRYYGEKTPRPLRRGGGRDSRERRWVIYNGEAEASKVPPEWHAWLHHTVNEIPVDAGQLKYPWQKPHLPNLTGTRFAYRPSGSVLKGGHRAPTTGDYEPWQPE